MINERPAPQSDGNGTERAIAVRRYQRLLLGARAKDSMMSGTAAFIVAIGGASLICYLLMNRTQNKDRRQTAGGDASGTSSSGSSGDSWSLLSRFCSDRSSSDSSTSTSDSSGDSGGGGGGD
jgi:hypothetical protein